MIDGVEYHINGRIFEDWETAAIYSMTLAIGGSPIQIDIVIYHEQAALKFGGTYAAERYLEDPDASVFERLTLTINNEGRVP